MKGHASPGLLLLIALMCGACAPDAPPSPTPLAPKAELAALPARVTPVPEIMLPTPVSVSPQVIPDLLGWWDRPEALNSLGLTIADGAAVAVELRKLERSYQTAQRQLYTVRRTQLEMLRDPRVPGTDIRRFHLRNSLVLTNSMMEADIEARLKVREVLSADRLAGVLERSPEFFRLDWFRAARDPRLDVWGPEHP